MRLDPAHLEHARKVADAILYEGYLLYPYRQSAQKNQVRFQFGVLMPPGYAGRSTTASRPPARPSAWWSAPTTRRSWSCCGSCSCSGGPCRRSRPDDGDLREVGTLYVDGTEYTGWDEAAEREQHVTVRSATCSRRTGTPSSTPARASRPQDLTDARGRRAGRLVREWAAADGMIRLHAERVAGPYQALRLRVRVENHTASRAQLRTRTDGLRQRADRRAPMIGVPGGRFLSMTDPPEWAAAEVRQCVNTGTWPVLGGPGGLRRSDAVVAGDPLRPRRGGGGERRPTCSTRPRSTRS